MDYDAADYRLRELGAAKSARADATRSYFAKMAAERLETQARPFDFADLNGKPEPESWGPCYPKTASASVEKWHAIARGRELTADESAAYGQAVHAWIRALNAPKRAPDTLPERSNSASGQAGEFSAAKHRATLRANLHAQAAADRLAWALGKAKDSRGLTIRQAYAQAMAEKRARMGATVLEAA